MLTNILFHKIKRHPAFCKLFRIKHCPADYMPNELLYRGFKKSEIDQASGKIQIDAISFPDFSCNWSRYSEPESVKYREKGCVTDGCFSFPVEATRFNKMASPCHDPIKKNYSHTEIRQLLGTEALNFEPPKNRKLTNNTWSKSKRQVYRQELINKAKIEIEAAA